MAPRLVRLAQLLADEVGDMRKHLASTSGPLIKGARCQLEDSSFSLHPPQTCYVAVYRILPPRFDVNSLEMLWNQDT